MADVKVENDFQLVRGRKALASNRRNFERVVLLAKERNELAIKVDALKAALNDKNKVENEKTKWPYRVKVKEWDGRMSEEALKRLLTAATMYPSVIVVEYYAG